MKVDIVVPGVGESIVEGLLASWNVDEGTVVKEGDAVFELETDKTTLDVSSPAGGSVHITVSEGTEVKIGDVVGYIETEHQPEDSSGQPEKESETKSDRATPAAKAAAAAAELDISSIPGSGRKGMVTKADVKTQERSVSKTAAPELRAPSESVQEELSEYRKPLSRIRRAIAANLKNTQNELALLTTFNEIDMSAAKALRKNYGDTFLAKHGVKLGFMSLFIKASAGALKSYPEINAVIDGNDILYRKEININVAVSTERGLVTPVIRNVESKSFAEIEGEIISFARKASDKTLLPEHLMGGTFAVTNGGIFGSLLSTPLPAPGESAILGMHAIQERPVAMNGEIVIRPMMYVALSYDHRLVDGREAVGFLKTIKESVEQPERLMLDL